MELQSEFKERLTRDVTRSLRHLVGTENAKALDGIITLQITDGVLTDIEFVGELAQVKTLTLSKGYGIVLDSQDTLDTSPELPKAKSKK